MGGQTPGSVEHMDGPPPRLIAPPPPELEPIPEVIEDEPARPPMSFLGMFGVLGLAAIIAIGWLLAYVIVTMRHRAQAAAGGTWASSPATGQVFAWLVILAVCVAAVLAAVRWIGGPK
jgi:hypothetical protein